MPTTVVTLTTNRFPELVRRLPREVGRIVEEAALEIETTAKVGMAEQKSGRIYGDHQASAPGEYPAMDTGALANSLETDPENQTTYVVHTSMEYAPYLEFGTANMEPRPFLGQAASEVEPDFVDALGDLEDKLR
jgi:HK97 gp10 family phage protein